MRSATNEVAHVLRRWRTVVRHSLCPYVGDVMHTLDEAKAVWELRRNHAFKFWRYCGNRLLPDLDEGPVYQTFKPLPMPTEFGPAELIETVDVYQFHIEFTPWSNGPQSWRTYVITWGEHIIEEGQW